MDKKTFLKKLKKILCDDKDAEFISRKTIVREIDSLAGELDE